MSIVRIHLHRREDTLPQHAQRKWCNILAASCVEALALNYRSTATMAAISVIWRFSIDNRQTQRIIEQLKAQYGKEPFEIDEQEPLFFALIASDHGRSLASMLRDYAWMFGFQTIISAIIVHAGNKPYLYWRLAPGLLHDVLMRCQ
ncbi:hypothetical protein DER45DRAFT_537474 [Fusarium avenaceum]|nr:hypothetical protein DER45DRAFT_537474 [Fusarium avenaceum]